MVKYDKFFNLIALVDVYRKSIMRHESLDGVVICHKMA